MMSIKNIFFVVCLVFIQLQAMESRKDLALPTDFYRQLLQNFTHACEDHTFEKYEIAKLVQEIQESGIMLFMGFELKQPHTVEEIKRSRFITGYGQLLKHLVSSSLRKHEGCFIEGEVLNPWEEDWNLEQISYEDYLVRFLSKGPDRQPNRDLADVMFGKNADAVCTRLTAMNNAEKEAHNIMLDLLQQ